MPLLPRLELMRVERVVSSCLTITLCRIANKVTCQYLGNFDHSEIIDIAAEFPQDRFVWCLQDFMRQGIGNCVAGQSLIRISREKPLIRLELSQGRESVSMSIPEFSESMLQILGLMEASQSAY